QKFLSYDIQKIGATQCWYGNGITLIPLNEQFHVSMQQAAPIRDSTGPFSKIYTWSVHRKKALHKYIMEDQVDGVIVGLNSVLTRPVSNALKIISGNTDIQLAGRNSRLFSFNSLYFLSRLPAEAILLLESFSCKERSGCHPGLSDLLEHLNQDDGQD
ncbi:MAG: hypothetical protein JWQ09_2999, partial [Segetibacter sp.]|nr:hypothetical protein [Segetibacter sp.]